MGKSQWIEDEISFSQASWLQINRRDVKLLFTRFNINQSLCLLRWNEDLGSIWLKCSPGAQMRSLSSGSYSSSFLRFLAAIQFSFIWYAKFSSKEEAKVQIELNPSDEGTIQFNCGLDFRSAKEEIANCILYHLCDSIAAKAWPETQFGCSSRLQVQRVTPVSKGGQECNSNSISQNLCFLLGPRPDAKRASGRVSADPARPRYPNGREATDSPSAASECVIVNECSQLVGFNGRPVCIVGF